MANHVEREQTNQVTELTADDLECVAGGFLTYDLTDVAISHISMSGHGGSSDLGN